MNNKYGIDPDCLEAINKRDKTCVYCQKEMTGHVARGFRGNWWTIEHINHAAPWNNPEGIVICCWSCNSSRGSLPLGKWFEGQYCKELGINFNTVAKPVKEHIRKCKICRS